VETEPEIGAPSVIAVSWLAASAAFPIALLSAAFGQGLGAVVGGCHWFGICVPVDRQPWALVNQPAINFASLPIAGGYWLGSMLIPLLVAITIVPLVPRASSLIAELTVVQTAWAAATVAVAWLPLIDPDDGHLVRFLVLHDLPRISVWIAPAVASAIALLPTLRLLELARRRRRDVGRWYRTLLVAIHLGVPVACWFGVASYIRGAVPVAATIAIATPVVAALSLAWLRFPHPYVRPLSGLTCVGVASLAALSVVSAGVVWTAGHPTADGKRVGVLWGQAFSLNNLRPWIDPVMLSEVLPELDQK
jgi:hypothetical protein